MPLVHHSATARALLALFLDLAVQLAIQEVDTLDSLE